MPLGDSDGNTTSRKAQHKRIEISEGFYKLPAENITGLKSVVKERIH